MIGPITDEAFARRRLLSALGGKPVLPAEEIDDLLQLAAEELDGETIYPRSGLNAAAAAGWRAKAALTADSYDLGGGPGKTLDESQWHDHCFRMATAYETGQFSVIPGRRRGSFTSIGLTTPTALRYPRSEDDPLYGVVIND